MLCCSALRFPEVLLIVLLRVLLRVLSGVAVFLVLDRWWLLFGRLAFISQHAVAYA